MDVWFNSPLMDRALEKSAEFKKYARAFMEQSLDNRTVQEKKDIDKLINTIDALEMKIARLEQKIEHLESDPENEELITSKKPSKA